MTPTRVWLLPLALVVAGAAVYLLLTREHSLLRTVSLVGPISIGLAGIAVLNIARTTRTRLAGRSGTRPIDPLTVARLAALGKASAIVGAPLAGIYAGLLARVLHLDSAVARTDTVSSAVGIATALALCGAGLLLETACRVKLPPGSGEQ